MQLLPQKLTFEQLLTKWASIINPLLSNPSLDTSVLPSVSLGVGANIIPHKLGRALQGYRVTRMRNVYSQIYDTQATNNTPQLTLNLNSSAAVVVDLEVF